MTPRTTAPSRLSWWAAILFRALATAPLAVGFVTVLTSLANAQVYCDDANPSGNADYYDQDSKCILVVHNATYIAISAQVTGPQVPAKLGFGNTNNPPTCGVGNVDVVCRRICADLPSGKVPGEVFDAGVAPATYALMDKFEAFDKGDHYSVCYSVRNWANHGLNGGENRIFAFKVRYKTFPPRIDTTVQPPPNGNGWNKSDVTVGVKASDTKPGGHGIKQLTYSATGAQIIGNTTITGDAGSIPIGLEGVTTLSFYAYSKEDDAAGPENLVVKIDKTLPVITGAPTPVPNSNNWNRTDVTVTFSCSDAISGVAPGSPTQQVTLSSEGKDQFVNGSCSDLADNIATLKVGPINIDKTPPAIEATVVPTPNENHWNNSDVKVSFTATDNLSGVGSVSPSVDVVTEGKDEPVVGYAEDRAGNKAEKTILINLDKTPPENVCSFDTQSHDIKITGTDSLSGVAPGPVRIESSRRRSWFWTIESRKYTVRDLAGNKLVVQEKLRRTKHSISVHVLHLQYNDGAILTPDRNEEEFRWQVSDDGTLSKLKQEFSVGTGSDRRSVRATFDLKKRNETSSKDKIRKTVQVKPGLLLLTYVSNNGQLEITF
jgi:hypothetical protein